MLRKIAVLWLAFSLLLTCIPIEPVYAAEPMTPPQEVTVSVKGTQFEVKWKNPQSITELVKSVYNNYEGYVYFLVDWRVNNGEWHNYHEITSGEVLSDYYTHLKNFQFYDVLDYVNMRTETTINKVQVSVPYNMPISEWIKENNVEFRMRYILIQWSGSDNDRNESSPFSNTGMLGTANPTGSMESEPVIGEAGMPEPPALIEAPKNLIVEKTEFSDTIELRWKQPETINTLVDMSDFPVAAFIDWKLNNGDWHDGLLESKIKYVGLEKEYADLIPYADGYIHQELLRSTLGVPDGMKLSKWLADKTVYFRVRYVFSYYENFKDWDVYSPYSETVSVGRKSAVQPPSNAVYEGASAWAVPELDKAVEYGLITSKISGNMSAPITREELCEIIMRMYERVKGQAAFANLTDFTDTKNPEIYKAYKLGIVYGGGNGKFAPNDLTNREQVACMIYRLIEKIDPGADFNTYGAETFVDENLISSWALESVKFVSKQGLIKGSNGNVNPKGTTTREQAVLILLRTYEKYRKK